MSFFPAASWSQLLEQLLDRQSLTQEQATSLMRGWLEGEISPALSGAILVALAAKQVTAAELAGMALLLQAPPLDHAFPVIDTCGTGGDGASTFNISTAVAFVAAAAGVKVAKHGNRSASSRVGSAVLQGKGTEAQRDAVALNAGLALQVGNLVPLGAHRQGVELAQMVLSSGAAWDKLTGLAQFLST